MNNKVQEELDFDTETLPDRRWREHMHNLLRHTRGRGKVLLLLLLLITVLLAVMLALIISIVFTEHVRARTGARLARGQSAFDDLVSKIPGAPWADGTVGGIMAANADHGRMHYGWAKEDPVSSDDSP